MVPASLSIYFLVLKDDNRQEIVNEEVFKDVVKRLRFLGILFKDIFNLRIANS